jgi:predicted nucleic acid-binding protein
MSRFIVDAPIAIKWFVPEIHSSPAARLLDGGNELYALDTLLTDAGTIVSTKARLGELSPDETVQVVKAIESVPLRLLPSHALLEPSLRVAAVFDLPLGEGMGITAAVQCDCRLVTAARTLYDRVQGTPFARHVKWVGDIR